MQLDRLPLGKKHGRGSAESVRVGSIDVEHRHIRKYTRSSLAVIMRRLSVASCTLPAMAIQAGESSVRAALEDALASAARKHGWTAQVEAPVLSPGPCRCCGHQRRMATVVTERPEARLPVIEAVRAAVAESGPRTPLARMGPSDPNCG